MKKRRGSMTLDERDALLKAEGKWDEFIARRAKQEAEAAERFARLKKEQRPILEDLKQVGWEIESIWDFVNTSEAYPEAVPVLLKHLVLPYSDVTKDGIARSLAIRDPQVKKAWSILVNEYKKAPVGKGLQAPGDTEEFELGYKDGLACALAASVTDETMPEHIELLKDRSHGEHRMILLSALRKSKNPLAKQAIEELADDPDLKIEIASWKKRKK